MIFKSPLTPTSHYDKKLFDILKDMNNMAPLMPEQVINIVADVDNFAFTIQGMGNVALRVSQRVPNSLIQLVPVGKVPFPFILNIHIQADGEKSLCCFEINAELNPLMAMMAKRPLQNLVEMMAQRVNRLS